MTFRTYIQLGMGLIGFSIWTFAAYYDESLRSDYMHFVTGVVVGMAALALRDMPPPAPKTVVQDEPKKEELPQ